MSPLCDFHLAKVQTGCFTVMGLVSNGLKNVPKSCKMAAKQKPIKDHSHSIFNHINTDYKRQEKKDLCVPTIYFTTSVRQFQIWTPLAIFFIMIPVNLSLSSDPGSCRLHLFLCLLLLGFLCRLQKIKQTGWHHDKKILLSNLDIYYWIFKPMPLHILDYWQSLQIRYQNHLSYIYFFAQRSIIHDASYCSKCNISSIHYG